VSYALETLKERDRRIARERVLRGVLKFSGYVAAAFVGVAVATPVAYLRGHDAGKDYQAELAKPTCRAPAEKATPETTSLRDKFLKECADRLRPSVQPTKEKTQ
jgi:hypothetical protein